MPKVKKARKRRHAQAVGSTRRGLGVYSHDTFAATRSQTDSTATSTAASATTTTIAATSNMAGPPSGITLLSNQGTPNTESKTTAVDGDVYKREPHLTKKSKRKLRRERFLSRLLLPGDKAKHTDSALTSMPSTLTSSLPSTRELAKMADAHDTKKVKKTKARRKEIQSQEVRQFTAVLGHPAFQRDPMATIRQHLENVAALEEKERSEMLAMAQGSGAHGNQNQNSGMDMSAMMSMMGTNTARLSKAQKRRLRAKQRK